MVDFMIVGILLVAIGAAVAYIIKQKKKGVRCIGCPSSGQCSGNCTTQCGCKSEKK